MSFKTKHYFLVTILYAILFVGIIQIFTGCAHQSPVPNSLDMIKSCRSACRMGVIKYVDDNLTCECK